MRPSSSSAKKKHPLRQSISEFLDADAPEEVLQHCSGLQPFSPRHHAWSSNANSTTEDGRHTGARSNDYGSGSGVSPELTFHTAGFIQSTSSDNGSSDFFPALQAVGMPPALTLLNQQGVPAIKSDVTAHSAGTEDRISTSASSAPRRLKRVDLSPARARRIAGDRQRRARHASRSARAEGKAARAGEMGRNADAHVYLNTNVILHPRLSAVTTRTPSVNSLSAIPLDPTSRSSPRNHAEGGTAEAFAGAGTHASSLHSSSHHPIQREPVGVIGHSENALVSPTDFSTTPSLSHHINRNDETLQPRSPATTHDSQSAVGRLASEASASSQQRQQRQQLLPDGLYTPSRIALLRPLSGSGTISMSGLVHEPRERPDELSLREDGREPSSHTSVAASPAIATIEEALHAILAPQEELPAPTGTTQHPRVGISMFALFGVLERASGFAEFGVLFNEQRDVLLPFLREVCQCMREFPQEDALRAHSILMYLLENPEENAKVGEEFYSDPVNSWPLHMLYLTCCFQVTAVRFGYAAVICAIQKTGGFMALGKGLFAALAVAMAPCMVDLPRTTAKMYAAAFYVGVLMHRQQYAVETGLMHATHRNFAILLVNIPIFTLRMIVERVNAGADMRDPDNFAELFTSRKPSSGAGAAAPSPSRMLLHQYSVLEVSRVISSRSAVVCGHPFDLLRLDILLTQYADFNGVKIHKDYIPASAPENSSYYNSDLPLDLLGYWGMTGIQLSPADVHVPLLSPVDGEVWSAETLNSAEVFSMKVAEAATCRNQDLTYSLQHINDGDVLLDFSTHVLGIGCLIAWTNKQITIFAAPSNRRESSVLPPPRRSPQDFAVLNTLRKMAILNEVLTTVCGTRQATSASLETVELSTSFEKLGLLRSVSTPSILRSRVSPNSVSAGRCGTDIVSAGSVAEYNGRPSISSYPANFSGGANGSTRFTNLGVRSASQSHANSIGNVDQQLPDSLRRSVQAAKQQCFYNLVSVAQPSAGNPTPAATSHSSNTNGDPSSSLYTNTSPSDGRSVLCGPKPRTGQANDGEKVKREGGATGCAAPAPLHGKPQISAKPPSPPVNVLGSTAGKASLTLGPVPSKQQQQDGAAPTFAAVTSDGDPLPERTPSSPHKQSSTEGASCLDNPYFNEDYVVQRNPNYVDVINVYQVSPLIKYYEMQFGCVLCGGAVRFAELLKEHTGVDFPPYTLLVCPTVFVLLELWDGFEFVSQLQQ